MANFRDIVLIITCITITTSIIIFVILGILLYARIKAIMESVKVISETVQSTIQYVSEDIAKPLVRVGAIVEGIRRVSGIFGGRRKKGEDDGKEK